MKESKNETRGIIHVNGFFVSTHTPAIHHTHSNNSGKVASYPAQHVTADAPQFLFSTHRTIHLYECDAHPDGVGVVK